MRAGTLVAAGLALAATSTFGCAEVTDRVMPSGNSPAAAPRAPDCQLSFFRTKVDGPYDELAAIQVQGWASSTMTEEMQKRLAAAVESVSFDFSHVTTLGTVTITYSMVASDTTVTLSQTGTGAITLPASVVVPTGTSRYLLHTTATAAGPVTSSPRSRLSAGVHQTGSSPRYVRFAIRARSLKRKPCTRSKPRSRARMNSRVVSIPSSTV